MIGVGDLVGDVALGDAVDVFGGDIQWPDDGIQRLIDALHDLAEVALMLAGIGAGGEFTLDGGAAEFVGVGILNRQTRA